MDGAARIDSPGALQSPPRRALASRGQTAVAHRYQRRQAGSGSPSPPDFPPLAPAFARPRPFHPAPPRRTLGRVVAAVLRVLQLVLSAAACALVAGLAALYVQGELLPPTDGAYGMTLWETLQDPFVRDVWSISVALAGGVGVLFALPLLWRVRLVRAVPVVAAASTVGSVLFAMAFPLAMGAGLAGGVVAMFWCRTRPEWRIGGRRPAEGVPEVAGAR